MAGGDEGDKTEMDVKKAEDKEDWKKKTGDR